MTPAVFEEIDGTKVAVRRDSSHSTESLTIEGAVYELVFQTDEMYWNVAMFAFLGDAMRVARDGNKFLDPGDIERGVGFEVREHKTITSVNPDRPWSRQDFIDEMDGWDLEDYFLPEPDPEDET